VNPDALGGAVTAIVADLIAEGVLPAMAVPEVRMERPKSREHGDYATNVALALAKAAGLPPRDLGTLLAERLAGVPGIASAEVAGPGFVNIRLQSAAQGLVARTAVEAGPTWGHGDSLRGRRVNVEFISANPTGPLHLGHTRWAAVGDALARVLAAAGADVSTEFYINDRGVQMDKFGASVMAAANGRPVPEDGYHGGYILDLAAAITIARPGITDLPEEEQLVAFREAAYALQLKQQQQVLELFRTHFDTWFSERSLHESGAVERGMTTLRAQGHVYEEGGAVWLRTTDFGDDKDRGADQGRRRVHLLCIRHRLLRRQAGARL
jgi:arginyl-tRNA synthetase